MQYNRVGSTRKNSEGVRVNPSGDRFWIVASVTIKRDRIALFGEDKYGHWWFEIGDPFDEDPSVEADRGRKFVSGI